MPKRPKASVVGIGTGLLSAYSAKKVRKLGKEFNQNLSQLERKVEDNKQMMIRGFSTIADLQVGTMAGIHNRI